MHHSNKQRLKDINNTGFGPNSSIEGGRLVNADGTNNLRKRGIPVWERISMYHTLLRMKRIRFFLTIFLFYTSVNLMFATIYFIVGVEHLSGAEQANGFFPKFMEAFFFSSQTLTTVGYGKVAPTGMAANVVASLESLTGIVIFAVMTGLVYGRFSRPRAYLLFSPNVLIAPYKDGTALMLRVASYKNNHLTDAEAQIVIAIHEPVNHKTVTKFYPLTLELAKVNSLALSWTIVHAINEDSPLYGYTAEDLTEQKVEVIANIKAFDDHFSNVVQQRTSYTHKQVVYGARFLPMFERAPDGSHTIMDLAKINLHEPAVLPEVVLS
jgi:inward rectifier potassium channel